EGATIGRDMDGARPSDPTAQALHVTTPHDVLELIWIVIRAEQRVLWPDRRYVERRSHERPVHHDGRADAVDARRVHDPFFVEGVLRRREGVGRADERGVGAAGEPAGLGWRAPRDRDGAAEETGRPGEPGRALDPPFPRSGSLCHAVKCPMSNVASCLEWRLGAGENRTPDALLRTEALYPLSYSPGSSEPNDDQAGNPGMACRGGET